jgi:hypothetical protein
MLNVKLIESINNDSGMQKKLEAYSNNLSSDPLIHYPCLTDSSNIRLLFNSQNTKYASTNSLYTGAC